MSSKAQQIINKRMDLALELFNSGFTTKAAQKRALDEVSRAYDAATSAIRQSIIESYKGLEDNRTTESTNLYYDIPNSLAHWKEQFSVRTNEFAEKTDTSAEIKDLVAEIERMVKMRSAIKIASIEKIAKEDQPQAEIKARVYETLMQMNDRALANHSKGLQLMEFFGGHLPVTADVHNVYMQNGTSYIRTFFFMNGKLTSLNTIIAVYQTYKDQQDKV